MMAVTSVRRILACGALLMTLIALSATPDVRAQQRPSPAEGPWSGQAQCVVVGKWTDYHDEQTHTWRLTGDAPTPAPRGSAQVYYTWPAMWSVQGSGRKTWPSREPRGREQTERWTIAYETKMLLRITEVVGGTVRVRIGAEGQRGAPLGSMRVTEVSGRTKDAAVQPWTFPSIEDSAANTTISGTSTRTYPEGFGVGWGQPPKVITTATCTWNFTRGGVEQVSANGPAGGRGLPDVGTLGTSSSVTTVVPGAVIRQPVPVSSGSAPPPYVPGPAAVTFGLSGSGAWYAPTPVSVNLELSAQGTWYAPAPVSVNLALSAQGTWYQPAPVTATFDLRATGTWVELRRSLGPVQPVAPER